VTKTGCQWRMLPKEFGPWQTVYGYFNRWSQQGVWQQMMIALNRAERQRQGHHPTPSAGSIDSQSIKTATQGTDKGYDGGKQINGRKRHLLVDTLGLIWSVWVTLADRGEREGLMVLLWAYFAEGVKRLKKLWVDQGYEGEELKAWVAAWKQRDIFRSCGWRGTKKERILSMTTTTQRPLRRAKGSALWKNIRQAGCSS
jgi:putative transposase